MSLVVFVVVLLAALLHASWNGMVKHAGDKFVSVAAVVLGHVPFGLACLLVVDWPAVESWPYIVTGAILHTGYQVFLMYSYRIGDLTQVYPIARGAAPLIVTFVSVAFLGIHLGQLQLAGVFAIAIGIMSLVMVRNGQGLGNSKAGFLALVTGCFIASYSLNDGLGARLAGSAVGFYGLVTVLNAALFSLVAVFVQPGTISRVVLSARKLALIGGGGSFAAYGLVTWAFTQAPIALVTALRETSIVFALIIGVVVLGERVNLAKVVAVGFSLCGAVMIRLGR